MHIFFGYVLAALILVAPPALAAEPTLDETFDMLTRRLGEIQLALEPHDHTKMGEAGKFYNEWRRPKGNFSGVQHRGSSCCNLQDCDVVIEVDIRGGKMFAKLRREPDRWYAVDPSIIEANQEDPRESPDGMSHGCVIGGVMACFVEGGGM